MAEPQVIIVITLYDDTFHSGIKTQPLALLSSLNWSMKHEAITVIRKKQISVVN